MFVLNSTVQTKLLGNQPGQVIQAAVKQLTDNAEKNPNKAITALKNIALASPPPRSLLDPLMTLLKHDKDKADRLCHLILSQLGSSYNVSDKFNVISQILLKNINGKNLSKKALALRSYGGIVPPGNLTGMEAVRSTVIKLLPIVSEASSLGGGQKILSSKDAATMWEANVVLQYCLLVLRYLINMEREHSSEKETSSVITDICEPKIIDIFILRIQNADLTVARHSAALLYEVAKRQPDLVFKALQNAFSAADSDFGGLFSLPLWRDVLAGTYLAKMFVLIAGSEYAKCVEAAADAAKKAREEAASLTFNEDGDADEDEDDDGDEDGDDEKKSTPSESTTEKEDKDPQATAPLVLKKPISLTPSTTLALAWAAHGMLAPKQGVKLFVETAAAFSHYWEMFCSVPLSPEEKTPDKKVQTILESVVDRINTLLEKPSIVPCGTKQTLLHLAETLGKALLHAKPCLSLSTEELDESWKVLERLRPALERIAASSAESPVIRGQALIALIWDTHSAADVGALTSICAAVFANSTAVFTEVWRSYEARVRTDSSFAVPMLETSMDIMCSRVSLTTVFPIRPFESAWATTLRCNPSATHRYLVELLRASYMPGNRANLQTMKRSACLFIGDNCRALLSMPPAESGGSKPAKTPTSEPENPALLVLLNALEAQTLTGTPLTARKDALEALAKTALTVPESRVHVYEFLSSLEHEPVINGLDDACGTLASLINDLISYNELVLREKDKSHDTELEDLRTKLQSYFNPAIFVL